VPRKAIPPLPKALAKVEDTAITTDDWIAEIGDDAPALAEAFATVDDTIRTLMYVRDTIKAAILKRSKWHTGEDWAGWVLDGERFPYQLPGGGMIVRRGGKEATRYDQPAVIGDFAKGITQEILEADVAARALDSEGTIVPLDEVVERVCRRFAEAAGATAPSFTSWRSGIAKQLGIDIKAHAEEKKTEVTLSVEGRRAS
jgi:hypothetical protein